MSRGKALQKQLEEDIATLIDILVQSGPLPPRHVRSVGSAIVRKWLVEGKLNDLGHDIGVKFELPAYDTSPVFSALPNKPEIQIYISGGIILGGVPVRSMYVSSSPYSGEMPIPAETESVLYSPGKFLGSKRVYFKGHTFTAEQIITFVANKHGGVHFVRIIVKRTTDYRFKTATQHLSKKPPITIKSITHLLNYANRI